MDKTINTWGKRCFSLNTSISQFLPLFLSFWSLGIFILLCSSHQSRISTFLTQNTFRRSGHSYFPCSNYSLLRMPIHLLGAKSILVYLFLLVEFLAPFFSITIDTMLAWVVFWLNNKNRSSVEYCSMYHGQIVF